MPKKNFTNIGELQGYEYLKGVITDNPDSGTDTCSLTIGEIEYSDVPIFYHCEEDSTERSNGAIEGAASGFADGDNVLVLKQREGLDDKIFVIGHINGAKHCLALGLVITTGSGSESVVWDIINDTALSTPTVTSNEAEPTGSQVEEWTTNPQNCIRNLPSASYGSDSILYESGGSYVSETFYNLTTSPPKVLFGISSHCFGEDSTDFADWADGETVTFSTTAGSTSITGVSTDSVAGVFDDSYLIAPDIDGAITETWTITVYVHDGNKYWYVEGATYGRATASGYFFETKNPLSSIADAAADQWELFYNEYGSFTDPCAPYFYYIEPMVSPEVDPIVEEFEDIYGAGSWPESGGNPIVVSKAEIYFNYLFGPNFTDIPVPVDVAPVAFTKVYDWWADDYTNDFNFWLSTGIAETDDIVIAFDMYSVCTDYGTTDCNDYTDSFRSDFHLFYYQKTPALTALEALVFEKINAERVADGQTALVFSHNLQTAAVRHAIDTAANLIEGHTGSDSSGYADRISDAGYLLYVNLQFQGTNGGTENVGIADVAEGSTIEYIATEMVAAWMASSGHEANILDENHTEMGIACRQGSDGRYYFSNTFGFVQNRWPGFGPFDPTNLKSHIDSNFSFGSAGDETRILKFYIN